MHIHAELQLFTDWLHNNPQWGGIAAFLVAFAESLAFVGTIVPGSVTMTAIGVLIGSGVLSTPLTLSLAIFGAIVGDSISYAAGYYLKDRLPKLWPFRRYPTLLNLAKKFFAKHGGKSVFLGRFIGPIRAMIPILAGMLHMKPLRFFPIDILAAIVWAPAYLLPGYLIGLAATALPTDIATHLLISLFTLLIGIWLFYWLFKKLFLYVTRATDSQVKKLWNLLARSKRLRRLRYLFRDANAPSDHGQFLLIFIFVISVTLFILTFLIVALSHHELSLNSFSYHFLRGFRAIFLEKVMILITSFSNPWIILPLGATLFLWLLITRHFRSAFCWGFVVIASTGLAYFCKLLYFSPRPIGILHVPISSSFPSAQATMAFACYSFIAWMICFKRSSWKKTVYGLTGIGLLLLALSRLYLGEHWLTDIIGAFFLGTAVSTLGAIIFQRKAASTPGPTGLIIVTLATLIISGSPFISENYNIIKQATSPVWLQRYASMQVWWSGQLRLVPLYRINRYGRAAGLLNIQWAGSLSKIRNALERDGWQQLYGDIPSSKLSIAARNQILSHLHLLILPQLLNDQPPSLVMMKLPFGNSRHLLLITLWSANITLLPQHIPLWIGTIDYHPPEKAPLFHHVYLLISKDEALLSLAHVLRDPHWSALSFSIQRISPYLHLNEGNLHYVLMIKPKQS